jgi:23S rRNA (uracil1939-C5)-methyltransferase
MDKLVIEALGAEGEGIARVEGRAVFVPGTIPGDHVVARIVNGRAVEVELETPSPERREAFCPEFGRCGGCLVQQWSPLAYLAWKEDLVRRAFAKEGIAGELRAIVDAHGAGRRRALIHVRFRGGEAMAGFMERGSHTLLPLDTCPILVPALAHAPALARALAAPLARRGKPVTIQFTATDSGIDADIRGHGEPTGTERQALIALADSLDLARLSVHGAVQAERRQPILAMGRARVLLPPGGFLQATAAGEETLARLALAAIGKARHVADLFCGCGPFALRIADSARVYAADGEAAAILALKRAAVLPGAKPVTAEARDLFRRPLLPDELDAFDCVLLDPPRAGAEAQMRQIAASKTRRVVSVSCDLQSFCRDASILIRAGFRMEYATPVDQFAWSRHVELVALFVR